MRRRKKPARPLALAASHLLMLLLLVAPPEVHGLMMMKSSCLPNSAPGCSCSWKSGKFVADCSLQGLRQVPKVSLPRAIRPPGRPPLECTDR